MELIAQQNFFVRCWNVCIYPTEFFDEVRKVKGLGKPFLHVFLVNVISNGVLFLIGGMLLSIFAGVLSGGIGIGLLWLIAISVYAGILLFVIPMLFVYTGLYHLFVKLFDGKGSFEDTFKALAYAASPLLLGFLIFFNYLLAIYSVILMVIGIQRLHKLSLGRAVAAVLIPIGIIAAVVMAVYFFFYFSLIFPQILLGVQR